MTLKEAMFKIESFCSYYDSEVGDALRVLAKDLEVLEILKESITYQEEYKYIIKDEKFMIFQHTIKGTEKVDKIKEWLKGEGSN